VSAHRRRRRRRSAGRARSDHSARQLTANSLTAGSILRAAVGVARRYPLGIVLVGAGLGWLALRIRQDARDSRARFERIPSADEIPVLNTGQARIYDPDLSPRHPTHDRMETQRDLSARA
jgi:hypothetical protein